MTSARGLLVLVGASLAISLASPGAAGASAGRVRDGDFTVPAVAAGSFALLSTGSTFDGWRVVGAPGNVGVVSSTFAQSGVTFNGDGGAQWLDLTGASDSATGVRQLVPTAIGQRYLLRFAVGNVVDPNGIFGVRSTVDVLVDGARVDRATNSAGAGAASQVWEGFRESFTATSSVTSIEFLNADPPTDTSNGLDDVSVTPVGTGIRPSSITTSIPTPREALLPVKTLAVNGGIAAAVALVLTFPSQLFNQTLQENYAAISLWWRRRLRWLRARPSRRRDGWPAEPGGPGGTGAIAREVSYLERRSVFALVFAGGAVANAFNQGDFGVTLETRLVTLIAVAGALAIGVATPAMVGTLYDTRRHGDSPHRLVAIPGRPRPRRGPGGLSAGPSALSPATSTGSSAASCSRASCPTTRRATWRRSASVSTLALSVVSGSRGCR